MSKLQKKLRGIAVTIVAVTAAVAAGSLLLVLTRAAAPFLSLEAEGGTLSAGATSVTDTAASAGGAVRFATLSPSGEAMPVGNLAGWRQVLAEDFLTDATTAGFDTVYAGSWCGYDEGTGGKYYKIISATGGLMRINLDGTRGAAGSFGPPASCWGGVYGKYTFRFKVTGAGGYGAANMVWPSSNVWGEGEVDFPEGDFNATMQMFQHPINCTDCSANIASLDTGKTWTNWHTASTEWTPSGVKYYLDGVLLQTVTGNIPFNNHRWTLQMARTGSSPATGSFDIDWAAVYVPM